MECHSYLSSPLWQSVVIDSILIKMDLFCKVPVSLLATYNYFHKIFPGEKILPQLLLPLRLPKCHPLTCVALPQVKIWYTTRKNVEPATLRLTDSVTRRYFCHELARVAATILHDKSFLHEGRERAACLAIQLSMPVRPVQYHSSTRKNHSILASEGQQ